MPSALAAIVRALTYDSCSAIICRQTLRLLFAQAMDDRGSAEVSTLRRMAYVTKTEREWTSIIQFIHSTLT